MEKSNQISNMTKLKSNLEKQKNINLNFVVKMWKYPVTSDENIFPSKLLGKLFGQPLNCVFDELHDVKSFSIDEGIIFFMEISISPKNIRDHKKRYWSIKTKLKNKKSIPKSALKKFSFDSQFLWALFCDE